MLRPGNAGANTAADHIESSSRRSSRSRARCVETTEILVRTDTAGATHAFIDDLRASARPALLGRL